MKLAKHVNLFIVVVSVLMVLSPLVRANEFYTYTQYQAQYSQQLTQSHVNTQEFELSARQIRSRVEHRLVNYLLGQTVDQYLDFAADDDAAIKSTKQLKLRVNRHHLVLVYRMNFNL